MCNVIPGPLGRLLHRVLDVRTGPVGKAFDAHRLGAMHAAEEAAARFHAVADDRAVAMVAARRECVDRTLEAVEYMRPAIHHHAERLVVAVSTMLANADARLFALLGKRLRDRRAVGGPDRHVA